MKPEALSEELQRILGDRLRAVILYGSAAAGDYVGKASDYNILVVMDRLGVDELKALGRTSSAWKRAGNPPPLLFTLDGLRRSADVFPIELMDIRESHRVLYGDTILDSVAVHPENLRLILERELKSTLIQLRESFLSTEAKPKRVRQLMIDSLSTVLVLFRASLRLFQQQVPRQKIEAMKQLASHISFDESIFLKIEALKAGEPPGDEADPLRLFQTYLETVESVIDSVDAHVHSHG